MEALIFDRVKDNESWYTKITAIPTENSQGKKKQQKIKNKCLLNEQFCHYFATEIDPHSSIIRKLLEEKDATGMFVCYNYRLVIESAVKLSLYDRADGLTFSEDRLGVVGFEGYRIARATHSVNRGKWYYETIIRRCPQSSDACVRLGWSRQEAPLSCTLGYKKLSYAVRSKKGTKFHNRIGRTYYPEGFKEHDVIGVLIDLPEESNRSVASYLTPSRKQLYSYTRDDQFHFKEASNYQSIHANLGAKDEVPNSKIEFFVNGKSCGVAFENIYRGFYFPSVALYGYKVSPAVEFNFGPDVKFLPPGAKPMSERVDEVVCEVALNDMIELIALEEVLSLQD